MATTRAKVAATTIAGALALVFVPTGLASMHWYRWHPSARTLQDRSPQTGSVVMIGLESMRDLGSLRARYHLHIVKTFRDLRAAEARVTRALLAGAASDARIRYVSSLGSHRRLLAMPSDPLVTTIDPGTQLPYEWQFAAANVEGALDFSAGSSSIRVGIIDTGVADIPDLAGKVAGRWTVSESGKLRLDTGGNDGAGHGTAVASLIAANVDDGFGMAGFGAATHVIAIRDWTLTDVSVAVALMKLDSLGVRIVNMSFGGSAPEPPIVLDAIHKAAADGMLLIAAAGNSDGPVWHPAADLQPVGGVDSFGLAVGASDVDGKVAFFSNRGDHLSIVAPGGYGGPCTGVLVAVPPFTDAFMNPDESTTSCYPSWSGAGGARYAYVAGTSFSSPEVAGIAALIWAARPDLTNIQVADIIKQSARRDGPGWTPTIGCGVLDDGAALELATGRSCSEWASTPARGTDCSATGQA